ncbi:MAG: hypothetical protein KDD60_02100, partial [Bdellovibrionales bacterium]|nr:hypothetical protein [Bdellovibrionales bacterium]
QIIRKSTGRSDAAQKLEKRFDLTEIQAYAVVDMRLYQLSKTSIQEIRAELKEKQARILEIDGILKSREKLTALLKKDLNAVESQYGDKRKSRIVKDFVEVEFQAEDFIVDEEVFAIVTADGWLKRIRQSNDLSTTRIREGDYILHAHPLSTLDKVVFITNLGYLYILPVTDFPSSSGYGSPIQKLLKFRDGERVMRSYALPAAKASQATLLEKTDDAIRDGSELVVVSASGMGYVYQVEGLDGIKKVGKRIMKLRDDDELRVVEPSGKEFALFTEQGFALVLKRSELPARSQPAVGVILIGVKDEDEVVSGIAKCKQVAVVTEADKEKTVAFETLPKGRRGLRGKKIIARSTVQNVYKKD